MKILYPAAVSLPGWRAARAASPAGDVRDAHGRFVIGGFASAAAGTSVTAAPAITDRHRVHGMAEPFRGARLPRTKRAGCGETRSREYRLTPSATQAGIRLRRLFGAQKYRAPVAGASANQNLVISRALPAPYRVVAAAATMPATKGAS